MSGPICMNVPDVPIPKQPYKQISLCGRRLILAGQVPMSSVDADKWPTGDIELDTKNILENIERVLRPFGADRRYIIRVRIYLTNFELDFESMNLVYGQFFSGEHRPPRTCVGLNRLPRNSRIEIEVEAIQPWWPYIKRLLRWNP